MCPIRLRRSGSAGHFGSRYCADWILDRITLFAEIPFLKVLDHSVAQSQFDEIVAFASVVPFLKVPEHFVPRQIRCVRQREEESLSNSS